MEKESQSIDTKRLDTDRKKRKKRVAKKEAGIVAPPDTAPKRVIVPPGKSERALMFLAKTLRYLISLVEKKINKLRSARLAKRMEEKSD